MKVSKELRERIKQLENEQNRQQDDLADLDSLRNLVEIEALEKELVDIHQDQSSGDILSSLDDINLDFEDMLEDSDNSTDEVQHSEIHDIDLNELIDLEEDAAVVSPTSGYVVCLLFNQDKPSEWSESAGGGWRGPGMGTRYPTEAKAQAVVRQLKQKWPDYPIKIFS